ncbi:MAG TPA: hypothetical protein PKD61_31415, partial [Polyangiaceae bacterium]|nr:hypothetical protein [Polyangiaceae bacterium]
GSCPASSTPKPASFKVTATVCQLTDAAQACGAGACVASAVFPYPPKACVVSNGSSDVACPAEYPVQYKYATGLSDSRTCVGCSCDAPSGTCSGAQVSTCNAAGCGGSCSSTNLGWCLPDRQSVRIDSVGTQGPCSPSGTATTTGSVTLSGNRTVCCVQ